MAGSAVNTSSKKPYKLRISYFKGFYESQDLDLAQPNSALGSGLTILVGSNNAGKSTVFDAILKLGPTKKLLEEEMHVGKDFTVELVFANDEKIIAKNLNNGSQITLTGATQNFKPENTFEFVSSRRHWNHRFNGEGEYPDYTRNKFIQGKNLDVRDDSLGNLLATINRHNDQLERFNLYVKRILPTFSSWTIATDENGDYIKYRTEGGSTHKSNFFGDGLISIFRIVAHLLKTDTSKILILDEPELSLHPQAQKHLAQILSEFSQNKMIFVATHSPYFVRWNDLQNGARLSRIRKRNDMKCEVFGLETESECLKKISRLRENYQTPHLLDCVTKELFFAENVVFVEGQEDVGLLSRFINENDLKVNFDFCGYGSGGAGNIEDFLELAKSLGLDAGAIFDGDKLKEAEFCRKKFDNFHIEILKSPDIRDKHKRDSSGKETAEVEKNGLFTKSGNLKPENQTYLHSIIENFVNHFSPNQPKQPSSSVLNPLQNQ